MRFAARWGAVFLWFCFALPATAGPPDALALSRRLDELYRAGSSHGVLSMTVTTPYYERTLRLEVWSRGMEDTLIRILAPPKEAGTATLKRGGEMWNFLPRIQKTIRIPPSMMMASWMGSDFTNDDLVRETSWEHDYHVALAPDPPPGRVGLVYRPREGAPVTWSKVVGWLDEATLLPLSIEYHDEKERKARVMTFGEIGTLGGRTLPRKVILTPLSEEKKGQRTTMVYEEMAFDVSLDPALFSLTGLRTMR